MVQVALGNGGACHRLAHSLDWAAVCGTGNCQRLCSRGPKQTVPASGGLGPRHAQTEPLPHSVAQSMSQN